MKNILLLIFVLVLSVASGCANKQQQDVKEILIYLTPEERYQAYVQELIDEEDLDHGKL